MCNVQEVKVKEWDRVPVQYTCIRSSPVVPILMSLRAIYLCHIDLKYV